VGGGGATSVGDGSREETTHSTVARPATTSALIPTNSGLLSHLMYSYVQTRDYPAARS